MEAGNKNWAELAQSSPVAVNTTKISLISSKLPRLLSKYQLIIRIVSVDYQGETIHSTLFLASQKPSKTLCQYMPLWVLFK